MELSLPNLPPLDVRLVAEDQLDTADHRAIQNLLMAAFPQYTEIFNQVSYWGARPSYRLWIATQNGEILAHLDFECRQIVVDHKALWIAGVGEVATHPRFHRHGVGRALMYQFHSTLLSMSIPFGYLQCRPAVIDFYVRVGWHLLTQTASYIDPDTNQLATYQGPSLVLPACATLNQWPTGIIDLKGMPW